MVTDNAKGRVLRLQPREEIGRGPQASARVTLTETGRGKSVIGVPRRGPRLLPGDRIRQMPMTTPPRNPVVSKARAWGSATRIDREQRR